MPLPRDKAWFPAKTYGWGWGLPLRWQGWIVMVSFIAALVAGAPIVENSPAIYTAYCMMLAGVLICICYWKGEKPEWRWGSRE